MKTIPIILAFILFGFFAYPQSAQQIVEKSNAIVDIPSIEMSSTLDIYDNKGRLRTRKVNTTRKNFAGTVKTIIKFTAPAEVKGTAMLIYDYDDKDDDLWIYMPALRKTRRIISSEKAKSFMDSEFSNADMLKPRNQDFNYSIKGSEIINGKDCHVIQITCKTIEIEKDNGYKSKISYIEKSNFLCVKNEFYNTDNQLFKLQINENYKKLTGNKYFAHSMTMNNVLTGRKSIMTIDNMSEKVNIAENNFTAAMLEK